MKPVAKRIVIKATILTLALHGFVLFSQYQEHSSIPSAIWSRVAFTFSLSLLFIFGMGLLLSRLIKDSPERGRSGKIGSR